MIVEINVDEREYWNETVRSFVDYDVFYLNEYVTAFMQENTSNGIPILLYFQNGTDRAINVIFKRDIAKDENLKGKIKEGLHFDLITPYGYGGFWGTVVDNDILNKEYNEYCKLRKFVCEFVRFELFSNYYRNYDGIVETRTHNVVRSLDMSIDEIWMDFKQKVRKNVKRANTYNLEIVIENTGKYIDDFLNIYYMTMDRSNAEQNYYFSKRFYETLNSMKDNIMYFHAMFKGKIISTELVIYGSENAYSYLGGTNRNYFDLRPNDFLKFEIIKWAKKKGLKNFVLGGGYGLDDGIFQYKICFAPHGGRDFYIGRKIFDTVTYDELCELRGEMNNENIDEREYFPKYRS